MKRSKLVCLGDSLTDGWGIDIAFRWSDLLAKDLELRIVNSGISGDTTGGMLARFDTMVLAHKPSHVIIMGGTNDLSVKLPNEQIFANLQAMTRYARFHGIEAIIGIPLPYFVPTESNTESKIFCSGEELRHQIEVLRTETKQFAQEDSRKFIDFGKNMTKAGFLPDGIHPNLQGHEIMKENAKEVLFKLLK